MPAPMMLRPAMVEDTNRLLAWRNDPATRGSSFSTREIAADEHRRWLRKKLADPDCLVLIVEDSGRPAGVVRADRCGGQAEVHITLAPETRGRGLAPMALQALAEQIAEIWSVNTLVAHVKPDNTRSLRAFQRAGFFPVRRTDEVVSLQRRLRTSG